jgi:hypothetical protein
MTLNEKLLNYQAVLKRFVMELLQQNAVETPRGHCGLHLVSQHYADNIPE